MKPSCYFRLNALRQGDSSHEVWALQLCLSGIGYDAGNPDGKFGPTTKEAVLRFQAREKLDVDGLAGQITQRRIFIRTAHPLQKELGIPVGLARGVAEGESGFYCGMVDCSTPGGKDCGWMGRRVYEGQYGDVRAWYNAYHGPTAVHDALTAIREGHDEFYGQPGARTHESAWKIAVGGRNWPAAAYRYAAGTISSWQYRERLSDGRIVYRYMDEPAEWVKAIGVPGVETGYEWFEHYVRTKVHYVKTWTT